MAFDHDSLALLADALRVLEKGFESLPPFTTKIDRSRMAQVLEEAAGRLTDNFPYHHPLYVGQMLKPPHPVARVAYALTMFLNPNNHALDGGRASSRMEKEVVEELGAMFGWSRPLGHLTGGGTMANFEALWVGRELRPGKAVAASIQAHYTHPRLSAVLGVPFVGIPVDPRGRMDVKALAEALRTGGIGTVVATLGSTAAGAVDPMPGILALRETHEFRLHVDAAYGGYYGLVPELSPEVRRAFDLIEQADSLVIDPHKHGLQPYGCGCVLFKDPSDGRFYKHDSPYTYFSSDELHLGEISLECSRPGASAVALWTTMRLLPLERGGEFSRSLSACREAALHLHAELGLDERFAPLFPPSLDIVTWAVRAPRASESSRLARAIFDAAAREDLHLALASFPRAMVEPVSAVIEWDTDEIRCLRACVMKPEHREWIPEIVRRLRRAVDSLPENRVASQGA